MGQVKCVAMKATYGEITHEEPEELAGFDFGNNRQNIKTVEAREIWKDPVTDDGTKKSAKGLLAVHDYASDSEGGIYLTDQCSWEEEKKGLLQTVFKDGNLYNETSLEEIRKHLGVL